VKELGWVCLGGAVGSGLRYLAVLATVRAFGLTFPFGTLAVNLLGSALLGALVQLAPGSALSPELRTALGVGLLGGFTTYSTFNLELLALIQQGRAGLALAYGAGTLLGGLAAGLSGIALARTLQGG
jgi:fluoride exporter